MSGFGPDSNKTYGNDQSVVADILTEGGTQTAIIVGTAAVEAKVGASPLTSRKLLTVYNASNATIYWGFTNAVTTATGTPILKDQLATWDISDLVSVYLISGSSNNSVRITESG